MPTVDNNCKVTSQTLKLTLVWYIFKLVLYFNYIIISNQNKSYLAINRGSVLQIRYGFYRHALQIHYQPWWLVIEREAWSSNKVAFGKWMFGDSWRKFIKALLLHKISFFFWARGAEIVNAQGSDRNLYLIAGASTLTQSPAICNHYKILQKFQGRSAF